MIIEEKPGEFEEWILGSLHDPCEFAEMYSSALRCMQNECPMNDNRRALVYPLSAFLLAMCSAFTARTDDECLNDIDALAKCAKEIFYRIRNDSYPDIGNEHSWRMCREEQKN